MSDNNQAAFMEAVRKALGHPGGVPRKDPPDLFRSHPSEKSQRLLDRIQNRSHGQRQVLLETLMDAAQPINLNVNISASVDEAAMAIAATIARAPVEWTGPRKVCIWNHPLIQRLGLDSKLSAHHIPVISSRDFFPTSSGQVTANQRQRLRQGIMESFVGVTSADYCVADTATLVLKTGPGQPRSVSLVPSIHIAVITADQVLADFGELYATLRWQQADGEADLSTCMTFISGPSKTADIEATLVHGAHGPKAMWLYIINPG
ncbi:LutC3: L-Lactate utilization protein C [Desulfosarcina variabilis str. Montpellier]|uniref:LutC/YkgG family protein n=1 Tax=Desulfosarcina variabilis TaxID=2300 RepID=UPI003AFB572E